MILWDFWLEWRWGHFTYSSSHLVQLHKLPCSDLPQPSVEAPRCSAPLCCGSSQTGWISTSCVTIMSLYITVHHLKLLWAAIIVNHSQIHREITWLLMTSFKVFHIPYQSTRAFVCNLPCKSTQTTWKSPGKLQSPQLGLAAEAKSGSLKHPIWPCEKVGYGGMVCWRIGIKKGHWSVSTIIPLSISINQWQQHSFFSIFENLARILRGSMQLFYHLFLMVLW